jgi:phage baseplate assembly protein V
MSETLKEFGASFKFGAVSAVDAKTCRVRVRLPDYDNLRTAWLPVLQWKTLRDKHYHLPDIGEHVVVLLDGRGEDGVVLGAIFSSADAPPVSSGDKHHVRFDDSAEMEYDRHTHQLTIKGGILKVVVETGVSILLKAEAKVTIDTPETEITGNLLVKKKLTYQGGMAGSGSGGAAAEIDGNIVHEGGSITSLGKVIDGSHTHGGIVPGGDNTAPPNQ